MFAALALCCKSYLTRKRSHVRVLHWPPYFRGPTPNLLTLGNIEPRFIFRVPILPEPASKGGVEILPFRVRTGNNLYSYPSVSPRGGVITRNIIRKDEDLEVTAEMTKLRTLVFAIVVLAMGGTLLSLNGCGGTGGSPPPPPGKIHHVVVIFQENRTPDNLFQDPVLISKGADIAQSGKDSKGNTIPLTKVSLTADYNSGHFHDAFIDQCDLNSVSCQCQMDGADLNPVPCPPATQDCTFAYVDATEVQRYFQIAEQYTFADRMFQTNQGPSFPAHQFIISGTSAPSTGSNLFAAENPNTNGPPNAGCDAPVGSTLTLIDPAGSETANAPLYPFFY